MNFSKVGESMSEIKYCRICGSENNAKDKFCLDCGTTLDFQEQPAKPPEQPVQSDRMEPIQAASYQQPMYGNIPQGIDPTMQYMMLKKDKLGPFLLSCFCFGSGLLMVDSERYLAKFVISFLLTFIFVGWILGIVWTLEAVDEYNREIAYQTGIQPTGYM